MKTLAIVPAKKNNFSYFNKIILCADIITGELIAWLQRYLAVNGPLIQIYSNLDRARQYHRANEHTLRNNMSPTTSYISYYQNGREDGVIALTPFRTHILGKQCGLTIDLVNTLAALSSALPGINPLQSICIDREKEDVFRLHRLLISLGSKEHAVSDLVYKPVYPYISSLCRWEKNPPNCRTLETVIVDRDNNVKTCWHGSTVGKAGMPFPGISANLRNIRRTAESRRGCKMCDKRGLCIKCTFPGPLSANEYCDLKRDSRTEEAAELLRTFDFFKKL